MPGCSARYLSQQGTEPLTSERPPLTEYRVALTLERPLEEQEIRRLHDQRSEPIANYEMDGNDVVMAHLNASDSLTARDTAELQVLRATGVAIHSAQLIP